MALATHLVQGSYAAFISRPVSCNRGMESKQFVAALPMAARTERFISLKCKSCLCVRAPIGLGLKGSKSLKISCFKGIGQDDESKNKANGSKSLKEPVKLSSVLQESEETITESQKVQDDPASTTSEASDTVTGSEAVENLFKNWLTLLRTPSPNLVGDETLEGQPSSRELSETRTGMKNNEGGHQVLRAVWCYFLGLDAAIKVPAMIFIPMSLGVHVIYGTEVSKELTPLWIFGPLFVALHVKALQGICALYIFSFKGTVKVVKQLPRAYKYIAGGKLKEDIRARIFQPWVNSENLDYKRVSAGMIKTLGDWLRGAYLDLVESVWPHYCKLVRTLKKANLA
ncbi:hypothetical protein LguiA_028095 [Lonicera macranthoides]